MLQADRTSNPSPSDADNFTSETSLASVSSWHRGRDHRADKIEAFSHDSNAGASCTVEFHTRVNDNGALAADKYMPPPLLPAPPPVTESRMRSV